MQKTLDTILEDMTNRVRENQPVSPSNWLDAAIKINALKGDLDNDIAHFEANLVIIEANYIKEDKPASQAKTLARAEVDYEEYLKAKAKAKRIEEFLRLAKKRSMLNEYSI